MAVNDRVDGDGFKSTQELLAVVVIYSDRPREFREDHILLDDNRRLEELWQSKGAWREA